MSWYSSDDEYVWAEFLVLLVLVAVLCCVEHVERHVFHAIHENVNVNLPPPVASEYHGQGGLRSLSSSSIPVPGAGSTEDRSRLSSSHLLEGNGRSRGRRVSTDHYLVKVYSRWRSELSVLTVLGVLVWMADQCGLFDALSNASLGPGYPSDGPTWAAFVMAVVVHLLLTVLVFFSFVAVAIRQLVSLIAQSDVAEKSVSISDQLEPGRGSDAPPLAWKRHLLRHISPTVADDGVNIIQGSSRHDLYESFAQTHFLELAFNPMIDSLTDFRIGAWLSFVAVMALPGMACKLGGPWFVATVTLLVCSVAVVAGISYGVVRPAFHHVRFSSGRPAEVATQHENTPMWRMRLASILTPCLRTTGLVVTYCCVRGMVRKEVYQRDGSLGEVLALAALFGSYWCYSVVVWPQFMWTAAFPPYAGEFQETAFLWSLITAAQVHRNLVPSRHSSPISSMAGRKPPSALTGTGRPEASSRAAVVRNVTNSVKPRPPDGAATLAAVARRSIAKKTSRAALVMDCRDIDLTKASIRRYGAPWRELEHDLQVDVIRQELKDATTCVVPTTSPWKMKYDIVVVLALLFTAIMTPYEVAFLDTEFNVLYFVNRFVDTVFLLDIFLQFFSRVEIATTLGVQQIHGHRAIAAHYLKHWFIIDLLSILPYDSFSLIFKSDSIQNLKALRIIRLLRLVKLVRVFRASRIYQQWQNLIAVTFATQALLKFCVALFVVSHWLACAWGVIGVNIGDNLQCNDGVATFLPPDGGEIDHFGESWITRYYRSAAPERSPNDACDPWRVYCVALYWSVMTITSVGYGDVIATRVEEHVVATGLMICGAIFWAYTIGAGCAVLSNLDPDGTEMNNRLDALNRMASEQKLPMEFRYRLRAYLRESRFHEAFVRYRELSGMFSPQLRRELAAQVSGKWINKVWYLRSKDHAFTAQVAEGTHLELFERREDCVHLRSRLLIVQRGLLSQNGCVVVTGCLLGEDMIVCDSRVQKLSPILSLTFAEVGSLTRGALFSILAEYPPESKQVRRAALLINLRRSLGGCISAEKQLEMIALLEQFRNKPEEDESEETTPRALDTSLGPGKWASMACQRLLSCNTKWSVGEAPTKPGRVWINKKPPQPGDRPRINAQPETLASLGQSSDQLRLDSGDAIVALAESMSLLTTAVAELQVDMKTVMNTLVEPSSPRLAPHSPALQVLSAGIHASPGRPNEVGAREGVRDGDPVDVEEVEMIGYTSL
mmetsp:Transcript_52307/g.138684  ORF Transcript_52307/g.138684 Transcript_52307/m.138684 type:complete len:1229 (+) Transcript_52307:140-3826(+)